MGPDCTEFLLLSFCFVLFWIFSFILFFVFCFLRSAATWRGFRPSLLYQPSDIAMVSWWAGTSLLRSLLVRQVAVGPRDRGSTDIGFCAV